MAAVDQYTLIDSTIPGQMQKDEASLFDDIDVTLAGVAKFAGATPPDGADLGSRRQCVDQAEARAGRRSTSGDDAGTAAPIEAGLTALARSARSWPSMRLSDAARYEIDFRLQHQGARLSGRACSRPTA